MNYVDLAVYQQAQALANSGHLAEAHQIFCDLRLRNPDIEILFGIATTTSNPVEAREMIDMIRSQQPYHPQLAQLETLHKQKVQGAYMAAPIGPTLLCPYCRQRTPARIKFRISTGGWWVSRSDKGRLSEGSFSLPGAFAGCTNYYRIL